MPHKQYYLEIQDDDICELDVQTSMATAKVMGNTEIVLKDRSILFCHRKAINTYHSLTFVIPL